MKADILQILHEEAMTQYNPEGKDERVVYSDEFDTVANQIIELYKPKWISVKDKLPTPNEVILIFWDNKITSGSYKYFHNGYFQHGAATQLKVTHWMPLPNKPISTTEA